MNQINVCCAQCGEEGVSLKACKSCMSVKYCDATCQRNHWPTHKAACKLRAAELRDEALFKDPPPKEDCPICFLPMPIKLICSISLPPATKLSVPIYDYAMANKGVEEKAMDVYYSCCGKSICIGCIYTFLKSGNIAKCPFCNTDQGNNTDGRLVEEIMKRVAVNDPGAIFMLANLYYYGLEGLQQDHTKAMELYNRATELKPISAHYKLGCIYYKGGDLKKTKFHLEAAAMAGHEGARSNLGVMEAQSGNMERAVKHWIIAASSGAYDAMKNLILNIAYVSRESIDSTLAAYNSSCAEIRSEARDLADLKWTELLGITSRLRNCEM